MGQSPNLMPVGHPPGSMPPNPFRHSATAPCASVEPPAQAPESAAAPMPAHVPPGREAGVAVAPAAATYADAQVATGMALAPCGAPPAPNGTPAPYISPAYPYPMPMGGMMPGQVPATVASPYPMMPGQVPGMVPGMAPPPYSGMIPMAHMGGMPPGMMVPPGAPPPYVPLPLPHGYPPHPHGYMPHAAHSYNGYMPHHAHSYNGYPMPTPMAGVAPGVAPGVALAGAPGSAMHAYAYGHCDPATMHAQLGAPVASAAEQNELAGALRRKASKGKQGWTREEDAKIVQYVQLTGQKWAVIAALLPGRTDDAVRNRYLRLQKKKQGDEPPEGAPATGSLMTKDDLDECESIKKGDMWTPEEDSQILDAVMRFGQKCARPHTLAPQAHADALARGAACGARRARTPIHAAPPWRHHGATDCVRLLTRSPSSA